MVAILVLLTILTFLTLDYLVQRSRRAVPAVVPAPVYGLEAAGEVPAGLFVGPGHAWLGLRPSGEVLVGADRLPLSLLGEIDRVETAAPGAALRRGDTLAVLHGGGRSVPIPAPVEGVVGTVNPDVAAAPAAIAADPFGAGWLCTLVPRRLSDGLKRLRVGEEGGEWMRSELSRLRDFLVGIAGQGRLAATLPDGGLPLAGVAVQLGDAEWTELTERFFTIDGTTHGGAEAI